MAGSTDPKDLDPNVFGGKRMTYYGRWTYKYEKAAELGAAACIIVHETEYAGYPFNVVQGFGGERFDLVTPDKNMGRAKIESWMSVERRPAAQMAGRLSGPQGQAATRAFTPVPLGSGLVRAEAADAHDRPQNVIGKINGSDPVLKNEYVVFSTLGSLGIGQAKKATSRGHDLQRRVGQRVGHARRCSGIARQLKQISPAQSGLALHRRHRREAGPPDSQYRADPAAPLDKTLADIGVGQPPMWGRLDVIVIGLGVRPRRLPPRHAANRGARSRRRRAEKGCTGRTISTSREGQRPASTPTTDRPHRGRRVPARRRRTLHGERLPLAVHK
jgi:hypothetical protein